LVRTAVSGDRAAVAEVFRLASLSNASDRENLLAHPELLELDDRSISDGRLRVAEIDGRVVGFATTRIAGPVLELEDLFVHPEWMRRGVATRLIADVVEVGRRVGATRVEVTGNPNALAFYERVGFEGDEQVSTFFGPGTRMHLTVPPPASSWSPSTG
jgi:GNAT superfamily N-acetyltransferase